MKNYLPRNTDGALSHQQRQEQILSYIGTIRSEIKALWREVSFVKTIERTILAFIILSIVLGITACIYFSQT